MQGLPQLLRQTNTYDNGSENTEDETVTQQLHSRIFFFTPFTTDGKRDQLKMLPDLFDGYFPKKLTFLSCPMKTSLPLNVLLTTDQENVYIPSRHFKLWLMNCVAFNHLINEAGI
ncbi:MAG: hypothetical protein N3F66_14290 [Spirochaetes bacterium]|nr:hypothetical protein [Spirochaetota bacterium]